MSRLRPSCPSERPPNPIRAITNHQDDWFRLEISRLNKAPRSPEPFLSSYSLFTALELHRAQHFRKNCLEGSLFLLVCFLQSTQQSVVSLPFYQVFPPGYREELVCLTLRESPPFPGQELVCFKAQICTKTPKLAGGDSGI